MVDRGWNELLYIRGGRLFPERSYPLDQQEEDLHFSGCMDSTLDFNQLRALHAFKKGLPIALLGGAGCGKSFLLRRLLVEARLTHGSDGVMVCAWTNQCAGSIGGRTIHSWFHVRPEFQFDKEDLWAKVRDNKALCQTLKRIRVLFVDEIAVLKAKVLDSIDFVMRNIADSQRLAFVPLGARQLVIAGDPFQLEPIGLRNEIGESTVFSARVWLLMFGGFGSGVVTMLSANHRQANDAEFFEILNRIRNGTCSEQDIARINSTGNKSDVIPSTHTVLCLRKFQVDQMNGQKLAQIPGDLVICKAQDRIIAKRTAALVKRLSDAAPKAIPLKRGCEVILIRKIDELLPGTRASVQSIQDVDPSSSNSNMLYLQVKADGIGNLTTIHPLKFEVFDYDGTIMAWRKQLPIVSAYALTVHRSQGLTLDRVAMEFRMVSTWIPAGMTYVALSRGTTLEGLWVRGLKFKHIVVNAYARKAMIEIQKLKDHYRHRVIGATGQMAGKKRGLAKESENEALSMSERKKRCVPCRDRN